MDQREYLQQLKRTYAYDTWAGRRTIGANLHVRGLSLSGTELPGWEAARIQRVEPVPVAAAEPAASPAPAVSFAQSSWSRGGLHAAAVQRVVSMDIPRDIAPEEVSDTSDAPSFTRSMWRPEDGSSDVLLNVNVFEAATREAAQTLALLLVASFQSPLIRPHEVDPIGDVALRGHGDGLLLFIRGNAVYLLRNAGPRVMSVWEAAKRLDQDISSKPEPGPTSRLRISVTRPDELRVGENTPLDVDVVSSPPPPAHLVRSPDEGPIPLGSPVVEKFFADTGEVLRQQGRLMYRPATPGRHEIEVFAVSPSGEAVREEVVLTAV